MAKYEKKEKRPTVDAIRMQFSEHAIEPVKVRSGDWLLQDESGITTHCSDEFFQRNYVKAE